MGICSSTTVHVSKKTETPFLTSNQQKNENHSTRTRSIISNNSRLSKFHPSFADKNNGSFNSNDDQFLKITAPQQKTRMKSALSNCTDSQTMLSDRSSEILRSGFGSFIVPKQIYEKIQRVPKIPTVIESLFIKNKIGQLPVFSDLGEEDIELMIDKMFYCRALKDDYVFKQGDFGSCFFIIDEGECQVEINNKKKQILLKGDKFGELALMYNAPRAASIRAVKDCFFWALDRDTFRAVLASTASQNYLSIRTFIETIELFDQFSQKQKDAIAHCAIIENFQPGQNIVTEGSAANSFYAIMCGRVESWNDKRLIREYVAGGFFDEKVLFSNECWEFSVLTLEFTTCLVFSRETLVKVLGADIKSVIKHNAVLRALDNHHIFSQLNQIQKTKLINSSEVIQTETQLEFGKPRQMPWFIFIVFEGCLHYSEQSYRKGEILGVEFLYSDRKRQHFLLDKIIAEPGKYARIAIKNIIGILGGDIDQCIEKNKEALKVQEEQINQTLQNSLCPSKLEDLVVIKTLNETSRDKVLLVFDSKSEVLYVIKAIFKENLTSTISNNYSTHEKDLLQSLNYPFIVKLHKTFYDELAIYLMTSFVAGLEMFDVIKNIGVLDNRNARFYIGSLLLTLEYLHGEGIVYRDLRPDRMIIGNDGYVMLVDFSSAKRIGESENRTNTIVGSPHYMAPEIILGKGYGYLVDLWSLGVVMYEFMCGILPYGEDETDPVKIYHLILHSRHKFTHSFNIRKNYQAINLMNILLNKVPEARLCGDYAYLKSHAWFEELSWDDLLARKLKAPYSSTQSHIITNDELVKARKKSVSVDQEINVS